MAQSLKRLQTPQLDEERLRSALDSASIAAWCLDLPRATLFGSESGWKLLGLSNTQRGYQDFLAAIHPDDRAKLDAAIQQAVKDGLEHEVEFRSVHPDGSVHWISARGRAHRDPAGRPLTLEGVAFDVTKRKLDEEALHRAELALLERQAQLALAIEHAPALIAVFDRDMRYLAASRRWISGFRIHERYPIVGRSHYEVFPEIPQRWREVHQRCLAGAVERSDEDSFERLDGSVDWLSWELRPWCTADGQIGGVVMLAEIITERKRAEEELRVAEERLRLALTGAAVGTWHLNTRTQEWVWSDQSHAIFGIPSGSPLTHETILAAVHAEDRERVRELGRRALRERSDIEAEFRVCRPDGTGCWVSTRGSAFCDAQGIPERIEGIVLDITPRKQVEEALRQGERRFRHLAEAVPHLVYQLDPSGALLYANQRWYDYFGRQTLERMQWSEVVHPDDLPRVAAAWHEMARDEYNFEPFRMRGQDGTYHWFVCRTVPVRDAEGNLMHVVGTSTDVDQAKKTEEALRESRALLDTALRAAGMGTWMLDLDDGRVQLDEALCQLLGLTTRQVQLRGPEAITAGIHAEDRERVIAALERVRRQGGDIDEDCRLVRPDGRTMWIAAKGRVVQDTQGRARRLLGACMDITQHKRLEEELRQSQKMEAIGRLAGGVAHDFNNLLTVILGYASALALQQAVSPLVATAAREIANAGERAASLTSQLLAFSRRQVMQFQDVRLNDVVASVSALLQRLLGENVALQLEPSSNNLCVHADPNMLTQVLLNLAVNARDAMPGGGALTIRTKLEQVDDDACQRNPEAIPGTWACLSVSDTGSGIAPEILPRVFEPFFTTKDVGKGTGLGLATVYGIVKQHRGFISVESSVGKGTTFKAYLPLASGEHETPTEATWEQAAHGTGETILLVEDDSSVREVVKNILEQYGYRLIVAKDGEEALAAFRKHRSEIDLVLTDVIMPHGLTGVDLVRQLKAQSAALKAILCSGYSTEAMGSDLAALPGVTFLQKPYRSERLLRLVRSTLDGT